MKKGEQSKKASETATLRKKAKERQAAELYSQRQKLYGVAEAPQTVWAGATYQPLRAPYQRPIYDAPGCVITEHLSGERLA